MKKYIKDGMPLPIYNAYRALAKQVRKAIAAHQLKEKT